VTPKIENGVVCMLEIVTDHVTDVSPVRAFKAMFWLGAQGTEHFVDGKTDRQGEF